MNEWISCLNSNRFLCFLSFLNHDDTVFEKKTVHYTINCNIHSRVEASNAADILSLAHKVGWCPPEIHNIITHPFFQYNAAPLKSFALAMISRNVEQVSCHTSCHSCYAPDQQEHLSYLIYLDISYLFR